MQSCDPNGLMVVSCFSSSVARIQGVIKLAQELGRTPMVPMGAMATMADISRQCGFAFDALIDQSAEFVPALIEGVGMWDCISHFQAGSTPSKAADDNLRNGDGGLDNGPIVPVHERFHPQYNLARKDVLLLATGCQGEPNAALPRLAGTDNFFTPSDSIIFSSRPIPGNEVGVRTLLNVLRKTGANVIESERDGFMTHVSGHPFRDDLVRMLELTRPEIVIPVHGEYIMQDDHAELARGCGVKHTMVPSNGGAYAISPQGVEEICRVPSGVWLMDGTTVRNADSFALKGRRHVTQEGLVVISVVRQAPERKGKRIKIKISTVGLGEKTEPSSELLQGINNAVFANLKLWPPPGKGPGTEFRAQVQQETVTAVNKALGKKPRVVVHWFDSL
jgi:mRNA degradation ribonuclease J1/J2